MGYVPPPPMKVPLDSSHCSYCRRPVDGNNINCVGCGAPVPTSARILGIEINLDNLMKNAPPQVQHDPIIRKRWVDDVVSEVQRYYKNLGPGDAFIHTDALKITYRNLPDRNPEWSRR